MPKIKDVGMSGWLDNTVKNEPIYWDTHRSKLITKLGELKTARSGIDAFIRNLLGLRNYETMYSRIKGAEENYKPDFGATRDLLKKMKSDFETAKQRLLKIKTEGLSTNDNEAIAYNLWILKAYPNNLKRYEKYESWAQNDGETYKIVQIDPTTLPPDAKPEIIFGNAPHKFLKTAIYFMSEYLKKGKTDFRKQQIERLLAKLEKDLANIRYDEKYNQRSENYNDQESKALQHYIKDYKNFEAIIKNYGMLRYI